MSDLTSQRCLEVFRNGLLRPPVNMPHEPEFIDSDIITVTDVFSARECQKLIERAEVIGFRAASVRTRTGPRMLTNIRNNDRVNLHDVDLANVMYERVYAQLPIFDGQTPLSADPELRFYRYTPGQKFMRHKDGSVTNADGCVSRLSYLVYLNDGFTGGDTAFFEDDATGKASSRVAHVVRPQVGAALLFRHERWHEGSPVSSGCKYVLRTDVFYGSSG